jgi:2-keto-4-pentenoate hydratase/2-oxohepta-3-ene-1,7-dioic acid hydratase in catechol pathway
MELVRTRIKKPGTRSKQKSFRSLAPFSKTTVRKSAKRKRRIKIASRINSKGIRRDDGHLGING